MKTKSNDEAKSVPPAYTSCSGRIRACVWESQEDNTYRHKIMLSKFIRSNDGTWQRGRTFWGSELAHIVEAIGKAQAWIEKRRRQLEFSHQPETVVK